MVHALIMSGYGLNCEAESAHAFESVGAKATIVHINDLIAGKQRVADFDIIMFPGGFSYGDDTGSGNAFANKLKNNLWEDVLAFIKEGKLILGVCNGFQIMTYLGLFALPNTEYGEVTHALEGNASNRYECRWVHLKHHSSPCVFTKGIGTTHIPVAHGEGRFQCSAETFKALEENKQIVFTYCKESAENADGIYPHNPNGAMGDVAAICDRSGRIMGMMPHPERGLYTHSNPDYALQKELAKRAKKVVPECNEANRSIFRNAVLYSQGRKQGARWD